MIQFKQVNFQYGEKVVVKDFSFTLKSDGITLFTGPSGCGKTTLFRLLAGLERPQSGSITAPTTAILFQENRLFSRRNVLAHLTDVMPTVDLTLAHELLALVELEGNDELLPAALSGGMQRRLSLARVFALQAGLYLLDEPFTGIDEALRDRILERLKKKNVPILMNGHEEGLVHWCDQVIRLDGPPVSVQA